MSLLTWNLKSASLGMATHVAIALPEESEPTHTLYLLHGLTGVHTDWIYQGQAALLADKRGIAIVMPDGARSFYTDAVHGLAWETWIGTELRERLAVSVRLPDDRDRTAIAGLSMGGYGAFRLALHQPDVYSAAMSLSGCVDVTEKPFIGRHPDLYEDIFGTYDVAGTEHDLMSELPVIGERASARGVNVPRLWATCGTEDRLLPHHDKLVTTAEEAGVALTHYSAPGAHTWEFWNEHLPRALDWWLT